jgi:hypothetical protein
MPAPSEAHFHAVSICMDDSPCHAIRKFAGQRLLSSEAPLLPLPDCDQSTCNCRFEHYADRRDSKNRRDRVVVLGRLSSSETIQEQRSWRERRTAGGL